MNFYNIVIVFQILPDLLEYWKRTVKVIGSQIENQWKKTLKIINFWNMVNIMVTYMVRIWIPSEKL